MHETISVLNTTLQTLNIPPDRLAKPSNRHAMGWGKKSSSSAVPKPPAQPPKSPAKPPSSSASQPSSRDPAIVPRADCKKNYYYQQMLHRQLNDDGSTDNLATRNSFSSSENKTIREDIRMGDQEVLRDIRELKSAGSNVRRSRSPQLRPPSVHQRLPSDDSMSNSSEYSYRDTRPTLMTS